MVLDLQGVFAGEQESLPFSFMLDMSDYDRSGIRPFPDAIEVGGVIENRAGVVELLGQAEGVYCSPCDRCQTAAQRRMTIPMQHVLVTSLNREDNDELILVEDMHLDLSELAESDIILALPSKFLCKEDCRGLCPRCGKDLNDGDCGCDLSETDPRLESLRQLLE